ncbi:radical SAM family heme chaperone HemW [Haliea sp.]|uniref:radical SAM family heme chaperone HemW n=1 Tax=Haliea sp. TaxID=1932666 RepID=UPI0025BA202B|nr:radical SAM family heme chaperone HemW [Haliea sp.]|tara:strand:- start:44323 stop:45465 length:1143 start_codon:yes stop_codon:yes gene_type:complete
MGALQLPPLSLYVHLPWCERKCPYCDFNSHETRTLPEAEYISSLLADLEADLPFVQGRVVQTLFIGGGTPSLFSAAGIQRLMRGIADRVALADDLEATLEANPGSAEAAKFAGFRAAGINRLSLGIQSFQDAQLAALGRVHDSDQAHAAVAAARDAGFSRINLDLMHGLPGQSTAAAMADLDVASAYRTGHLSWYQLTIEQNTVFYKQPPVLPVEDVLADIQDAGEHRLQAAGLHPYEVSAWAATGEQCRHNLNYWEFGDYLGIGAGAHGKVSFPDGRILRYAKRRQPDAYLAAAGDWRVQPQWLGDEEKPGEFMLNALRLNAGFALADYTARTGLPLSTLQPALDTLLARGLLVQEGNRLRASALGRRFLDSVVTEFLC